MQRTLLTLAFWICPGMAFAAVVNVGNPGFEVGSYPVIIPPATAPTQTTIPGPGSDIDPGLKGGWGHNDGTRFVSAQNGITPHEGGQMLQFVTTGYPGPDFTTGGTNWQSGNYGGNSSDIVQLVDLSDPSLTALIAQGNAMLTASVWVNRIASADDTEFRLSLWTFSGPFNDLTNPANTPDPSRLTYGVLFSDSIAGTWERLTLSILLPGDTTFVRLGLSALEGGTRTSSYPELPGHYADAVSSSVSTVPLPAALPLFLCGLAGIGWLGGRRKAVTADNDRAG